MHHKKEFPFGNEIFENFYNWHDKHIFRTRLKSQLQLPSEYRTPEYRIHLNNGQYGCPVFKWQSRQTIQVPDILTINRLFQSVFQTAI